MSVPIQGQMSHMRPLKKKKRAQEQKVPVLEIEGRRNLELTLAIAAKPPPAVSVA